VASFVAPMSIGLAVGLLRSLGIVVPVELKELFRLFVQSSLFVAPTLAITSAVVARWWKWPGAYEVCVDEHSLVLTGAASARRVPRARIESALLLPGLRDRVELQLRGGDLLELELDQPGAASALVRSLQLGATERRLAVETGGPRRPVAAGCAGISAALLVLTLGVNLLAPPRIQPISAVVLLASMLLATFLIRRVLSPRRIVVGTDGLVIQGAFRERYLPYSMVNAVTLNDQQLLVHLDNDGVLVVPLGNRGVGNYALLERIREAMNARCHSAESLARAELLDPGGRAPAEWRRAMAELLRPVVGYREAPLGIGDLMAVAEDPGASAGRRLGAALALAGSGDVAARGRLRVAAEACANERMRIALARAADDELDDMTLERALEEAEAPVARGDRTGAVRS
jgi:hypothetical protein